MLPDALISHKKMINVDAHLFVDALPTNSSPNKAAPNIDRVTTLPGIVLSIFYTTVLIFTITFYGRTHLSEEETKAQRPSNFVGHGHRDSKC